MIASVLRKIGLVLLYGWMPATLIALWWTLAPPHSLYFPALYVILDYIKSQWVWGLARADLVPSLEHLAAGYFIAVVGGIALGLALYVVPVFYRLSFPVISFFRGLPSIALIPPFILILGLGGTFKIGIIVLGAIQPVLLNTVNGLQSIDNVQAETARVYRITRWQRTWRVLLPGASPQIVAGCRTALQAAILLTVASEIIASASGIGYAIVFAEQAFDGPGMWSGMVILGILGIVLNLAFIGAERLVLRWYIGMRALEART